MICQAVSNPSLTLLKFCSCFSQIYRIVFIEEPIMLSEDAESEEEYTRKKDGDDARESQSNLTETDSRLSRESRMDSVESDLDPFGKWKLVSASILASIH